MIPNVVSMSLPVQINPDRSSLFCCSRGDVLGIIIRKHGEKRLLKFRNAVPCDGDFSAVEIDSEFLLGTVFDVVCSVCGAKRDCRE